MLVKDTSVLILCEVELSRRREVEFDKGMTEDEEKYFHLVIWFQLGLTAEMCAVSDFQVSAD